MHRRLASMITEANIRLADGRTLHAYDTRADGSSQVAVFWHHGSPNIGSPPEPLFAAAEANGLHWVSYDRPGYGGSSPHDGRTVASPVAARTRWRAPRCCPSASSPR